MDGGNHLEIQCQVHRGAKGLVYTTLDGVSDGEADNIDINVEGARPLAGAVVVVTEVRWWWWSGED